MKVRKVRTRIFVSPIDWARRNFSFATLLLVELSEGSSIAIMLYENEVRVFKDFYPNDSDEVSKEFEIPDQLVTAAIDFYKTRKTLQDLRGHFDRILR